MGQSLRKTLLIIVTIIIVIGIALIAYPRFLALRGNNLEKQVYLHQTSDDPKPFYIKNKDVKFKIRISDNDYERQSGLSGYTVLNEDEGMLFVFEKPDYYQIWMKDMLFPIDIIWLDGNFNIVTIKKDVSPTSYPNSFGPTSPSKYVLEINAGLSDKHGFQVGDQWQEVGPQDDF